MAQIIVLGSNFAGMTAALELLSKLGKSHDIAVVSPSSNFLYVPSLIWVPFGKRKVQDITFPVEPVLKRRGIDFINKAATRIEPVNNQVNIDGGQVLRYDYLVVATGVNNDYSILPNLDPADGYVNCIVTPSDAEQAYHRFMELVKKPGPVVVGATQGASCMGAAYEYLFNMDKALRKHGVRKKVDLTWITPEPFLGHFGIGGITGGRWILEKFMKMYNISWRTDSIISEIKKDKIIMQDGEELPYSMSMLIPPFVGAKVMQESRELVDAKGFVPCDEGYQHETYKNVYAAGLAVEVIAPFKKCAAPFGVPKTGFPSDVMGKIVAHNIKRDITGKGKFKSMPFGKIPGLCIMDAGSKEVWIVTNHLFKPRQFEMMVPNVFYNFMKIFLEKYMIFKNKRGWSWLP